MPCTCTSRPKLNAEVINFSPTNHVNKKKVKWISFDYNENSNEGFVVWNKKIINQDFCRFLFVSEKYFPNVQLTANVGYKCAVLNNLQHVYNLHMTSLLTSTTRISPAQRCNVPKGNNVLTLSLGKYKGRAFARVQIQNPYVDILKSVEDTCTASM